MWRNYIKALVAAGRVIATAGERVGLRCDQNGTALSNCRGTRVRGWMKAMRVA